MIVGLAREKKSLGTVKEDEFKKGKGYSSVVYWLNTICSDPVLVEEINRSARAMKQIQLEAWHLVNLHTLRCLEGGLPPPDFSNKPFYDHCCAGVSSTPKTRLIEHKNLELWNSMQIYKAQRERSGLQEVPNQVGYSTLKQELRDQMVVNAGVMIREHFCKRLRLYVRIKFRGLGCDLTKMEKKTKSDLVRKIMDACFSTDDTEVLEARQVRELLTPDGVEWGLQWIPWPGHIEKNGLAFYVRLLWNFQTTVETRMAEVPSEKGIRAFSIFPISTTYTSSHIKINGSTLAGSYSRIKQRFLEFRWENPDISLSRESFIANRWIVMRNTFDISRFETRTPACVASRADFLQMSVEEKYNHTSRLFVNQVTTDGYSASVLLFRPKTKAEKNSAKKAVDGLVVLPGYNPNIVIGLDPGMRSLCTTVREDLRSLDQRLSRGDRNGNHTTTDFPDWINRVKEPPRSYGRELVQVTTREYRHIAGFNKFRAWNEGLKARRPDYRKVIAEMPSFKTANYTTYLERLDYFWRHVTFLLDFSCTRPFRKWKFFRKRMARIAVDALAKRIVPEVSIFTCVAYGDWSRRNGINGHAPSPVEELKQALMKRAMAVSMDEFRTSKLCSKCHQTLSSAHYSVDTKLSKRKKCKGNVLNRNQAEVQLEEKNRYGVLRCDHADCNARYWNRDVNAAINMVNLLKSEVLGEGRLEAFIRR